MRGMGKLSATVVMLASGLLLTSPANAAGSFNSSAQVTLSSVETLYSGEIILTLQSNPAGIACASGHFMIWDQTTEDSRHQMLAVLLTALNTGKVITLGYDSGACDSAGYIDTYMVMEGQ
jgi:hypothetical protein